MTAVALIGRIYELYAAGDIDGTLAHCSDDFDYDWPFEPSLAWASGRCSGKDAFRARLAQLRDRYDYHLFRLVSLFGEGDRAAAQVEVELTHRGTGRRFRMVIGHFWKVREGKATELIEYFDGALVDAVERQAGAVPAG